MSSLPSDLCEELSIESRRSSGILLLVPGLSDDEATACLDLLTVTDPSQENVLSFTCTQSPTDQIDSWTSEFGKQLFNQTMIVSIGEQAQSPIPSGSLINQNETISIETVSNAGDLTKIGIILTSQLERWSDNDKQTVVCFHSLTTILQYADLDQTFQFLNQMLTQLRDGDVIAHFHLDPTAHDDQTVNTLSQLFDTIVEIDQTGERTIKQKLSR